MTDLAGFDACFAIGAPGVGQALQGRIEPLARDALRAVPLFLPGAPTATLDLSVDVQPSSTITDGSVAVTLAAAGALRMSVNGASMVTVPPGQSVPAGVTSLPVSVSGIPFAATLTLTIRRSAPAQQVAIGRTSVAVTTPDFPPANLTDDIRSQLTTQLTALVGGVGTVVSAQVNAQASALAGAIPNAVTQVVRTRLEGLFPLRVDFALPSVSGSTFCDIGLRDVQVALLAGQAASGDRAATAPCLAIATSLLPSSAGALDNLRSPLPTNEAAGLFFDNFFLISAVCCGIRNTPQFSGLPAPDPEPQRSDANPTCGWTDLNVEAIMEGRTFRLREASVTLDGSDPNDKSFAVRFRMTTSGTGWTATIIVNSRVRLGLEHGTVIPVVERPTIDITVNFEWWVWAIAVLLVVVVAALAAILAGAVAAAVAILVGGAVAGAALLTAGIVGAVLLVVGLVVMFFVVDGLGSDIEQSVSAAVSTLEGELERVRVIPPELHEAFGRLLPTVLHFDDLRLLGHVVVPPPPHDRPLISVTDLVIGRGGGIDLDRATVISPDDPDCDLEWGIGRLVVGRVLGTGVGAFPLPVTTLSATWTAAVVPVSETSYAGLTLATVRRLPFPPKRGSVPGAAIPIAGEEPPQTLVFGARTGEGRYAKGSVWQDQAGRLHLRYALFDTPAAVRLTHAWRRRRGPRVEGAIASRLSPTWELVNICQLQATPVTLQPPVQYEWTWNASALNDRAGPLDGGVATVSIAGPSCTLESEMGASLAGEICVKAVDSFGIAAQVCRELEAPATHTRGVFPELQPTIEPIRTSLGPAGPQIMPGIAENERLRAEAAASLLAAPPPALDLTLQLREQLETLQARRSR